MPTRLQLTQALKIMKNDFRMQDLDWDLTEGQIANMFPNLKEEDRADVAAAHSRYLKVVALLEQMTLSARNQS